MRRKVFCLLMALVLLGLHALAVSLPDLEGLSRIAGKDAWKQYRAEEIQALKLDRGGAMAACLDQGRVAAFTLEIDRVFEDGSEDVQAERTLAEELLGGLGCFSREQIEQICAQEPRKPLELSGFSIIRLEGRNRWAICLCSKEELQDMRFIAVHGGVRIHTNPSCSGMDTARMVTKEAAQATGLEPCGLCGAENR